MKINNNTNKIYIRTEMPPNGLDDMILLNDLNEGSILWNLKIIIFSRAKYSNIKVLI